jgi:hypothetical protein
MSMTIDVALKEAMRTEGAIGAALVDYGSGMSLGEISVSKELDLTVAAAGNTEVVRAKMRTMEMLKMTDSIEDILITLGRQYPHHQATDIAQRHRPVPVPRARPQPREPGTGPAPDAGRRREHRDLTPVSSDAFAAWTPGAADASDVCYSQPHRVARHPS